MSLDKTRKLIDRPILIIGCNRSGTTLLFNNLSEHPEAWSLYEESQHIFYRHYPIHPELGDRLVAPPSDEVAADIIQSFFDTAHNKEKFCDHRVLGRIPRKLLQRPVGALYKRAPLRLVEKTPANCLRIPFLVELFPDAIFVFLVRRAEDVISSLMEGWKNWSGTGTGVWRYGDWHYIVPPGWQDWTNRSLQEICAFQWVHANRTAWEDLNRYCAGKFAVVRHEDAVANPQETFERLREFCQLRTSPFFDQLVGRVEERVFTHGGSSPQVAKWKKLHYREVESVRPMFQPLMDELYGASPIVSK